MKRRHRRLSARRGSTLLLALGVLVILGLAAAALGLVVQGAWRDVGAVRASDAAQAAAENAAAALIETWDARAVARAADREDLSASADGLSLTAGARLLPYDAVRVAAEAGTVGGAADARRARRVAARYLRQRVPILTNLGALTVAGPVEIMPGAQVSGTTPLAILGCLWELLPGGAVHATAPSDVTVALGALLDGAPLLAADAPALMAEIATAVASLGRPTLVYAGTLSTVRVGPEGTVARCTVDDMAGSPHPTNWGGGTIDTRCRSYLPYVQVQGDLRLPTGEGQGVLEVRGDLVVTGDFRWRGLVLVDGAIDIAGPGVDISGAVVGRTPGALHRVAGGATIVRDPCAVRRGLAASARVTPVTGGAWSGLP